MRLIITIISMFTLAQAQFGFFDQMFGGGHEQHHQHQGHGHGHGGNVPSDANMYRQRYDQCKREIIHLYEENALYTDIL